MMNNKDSDHFLADMSLWGLILSNLFSIIMAVAQGWNLGEVMWVFWAQSIVIGAVNFIRILSLREFSTENFTINDRPAAPTPETKRFTAFFFLFHFGFFHFVYAMFLWEQMPLMTENMPRMAFLVMCALGFAGAHGFSFAQNFEGDFRDKKPNIGTLMFYPYLRIIPMHFTILFGGAVIGDGGALLPLLVFMVLKTFADAGMHVIEHRLFRKAEKLQSKPTVF